MQNHQNFRQNAHGINVTQRHGEIGRGGIPQKREIVYVLYLFVCNIVSIVDGIQNVVKDGENNK